jgi:6-phosphogluconolactonase
VTVWDVYVGTFTTKEPFITGEPSEGLEHFTFDDGTGSVNRLPTTTGLHNPQYLTRHPTLPVIYAAEASNPGAVSSFRVKPDGALEALGSTPSMGDFAVAVGVHPSGGHVYVANWGNGTTAALALATNGKVLAGVPIAQRHVDRHGVQVNYAATRPHHIRPTPSGDSVLVAYAGSDELATYAANPDGGVPSEPITCVSFPADSATRHIEFHPSGSRVYVVGERDSLLYVLEAEGGRPTRIISSHLTPPAGFESQNRTSELKIHPDGSVLYVGNRGSDCVAMFALDDAGDVVEILDHQPTGGAPRGLTLDPTGRHMLVANTDSCDVVVFAIGRDRRLEPLGISVPARSPSSVLLVDRTEAGAAEREVIPSD